MYVLSSGTTHPAAIRTSGLILSKFEISYTLSFRPPADEYKFVNIASSDIVLPEIAWEKEEKKKIEKEEKENKLFLSFVHTTIGEEKIEKISFWQDLWESVAILYTPNGQPTAQMTRMMKSMGQTIPTVKKTLIVNPNNSLVQKYISLYNTDPLSEKVKLFVEYAYEQALLLDWSEIESINNFLIKSSKLME